MGEEITIKGGRAAEWVASSVEAATERVRHLIGERGLAPGDALPAERDLADLFGVSRNTIRESLRVLEAFGVIERGRRGAIVRETGTDMLLRAATFQIPLEHDAYADVQAFRHVVEVGHAAAILQRITPADVSRLRRINASILDDIPVHVVAERDFTFHVELMRCSGNDTVVKVFSALSAQLHEVMGIGKDWEGRLITMEGHNRILDALEARSLDALRRAFDGHFEDSLRNVRSSSVSNTQSASGISSPSEDQKI